MLPRILLIVVEVLFITVLNYYMASTLVSLDVLYCLPVIQTARFGALQAQRDSDSHSLTVIAVLCALAWSMAEAAVVWPNFPMTALVMNIVTRAVTFTLIGRVIVKVWRDKEYSRKDWLTGLPDRTEFAKWFEVKQAQSEKAGTPYSLLYLNINDFREFNERHGYQTGDTLLVELANVLEENSRRDDIAARIGNDEFLLLLYGANEDLSGLLAGRLLRAIRSRLALLGWEVGMDCGCTTATGISNSMEELIRKAAEIAHVSARKEIQGGQQEGLLQPL